LISFEFFTMDDASPIYAQIVKFIKRGAAAGTIVDGDELPSRRMLSARLGVNPNTVQKAYRMLEDEGLVQSHAGAKSLMLLPSEKTEELRIELMRESIDDAIAAWKAMGITKEEALRLIDTYWK